MKVFNSNLVHIRVFLVGGPIMEVFAAPSRAKHHEVQLQRKTPHAPRRALLKMCSRHSLPWLRTLEGLMLGRLCEHDTLDECQNRFYYWKTYPKLAVVIRCESTRKEGAEAFSR